MKILVTGFDPFGGEAINPAIESVKRLPDTILNATIIKLEIPTVIRKSLDKIKAAMIEHDPDIILSIGQAGGRSEITIERIGINVDDCRIPDNAGNQPIDTPVFLDGPDAYFSNLPIKAMVAHICNHQIPASISNSAGTFICNHVLYGVRHMIAQEFKGKKSGFIHIPYLPMQVVNKVNQPSMSLETITKGLEYAIEAMLINDEDIKISGGTIC